LPKPGYTEDQNEDAAGGNSATLRFAVADGATEGWQSGEWARHLVGAYVNKPPMPADYAVWVDKARIDWPEHSAPIPLDEPWFAQAKREEGTFATLAGFELIPAKDGRGWRWKALAVGDSCLFLIRGERLVESFPLNSAEQFGMQPKLLASWRRLAVAQPEWLAGTAEDGDVFALATDAVAAGMMIAASRNEPPCSFEFLRSDNASSRKAGLLDFIRSLPIPRDDDLTLLAVQLPMHRGVPR
jgi:hypothetical protein